MNGGTAWDKYWLQGPFYCTHYVAARHPILCEGSLRASGACYTFFMSVKLDALEIVVLKIWCFQIISCRTIPREEAPRKKDLERNVAQWRRTVVMEGYSKREK